MSDTPAPIVGHLTARQLVYTNVEEDLSPHRRRGFQVWLHTDIEPPVRDEIDARVNAFVVPSGLGEPVERQYLFAPLSTTNCVLLARTTPLAGLDKFGRGGRYHTHALVADADDFSRVASNNPFAIFDGPFPFQTDPVAFASSPAGQAALAEKRLPVVNVPVVEPHAPVALPEKLAAHLPTILAWLADDPGDVSLALPLPSSLVEVFGRVVLAALPPERRPLAALDTLWAGRGPYAPRLCGAGSMAALNTWSYRRFARFDPASGRISPPLPAKPDWLHKLAAWWPTLPPGPLADEDRSAAFALARWVNADGVLPALVTPQAVRIVREQCPQTEARWHRQIETNLAALPEPLRDYVRPAALLFVGGWGVAGVNRLRDGFTPDAFARWAWERAIDPESPLLPADVADAVIHWAERPRTAEANQLAMIAHVGSPTGVRVAADTTRKMTDTKAETVADYYLPRVPAELHDPAAAEVLVHTLLGPCSDADFDRADLLDAIWSHRETTSAHQDRLRFLLKCDGRAGGEAKAFLTESREVETWLTADLLQRAKLQAYPIGLTLDGVPDAVWDRFRPDGIGGDRPILLVGVRIAPNDRPTGLVRVLAAVGREYRHSLFAAVLRAADPVYTQYPKATDDRPDKSLRDTLKECRTAAKENDHARLAELLAAANSHALFRLLANEFVLPRVRAAKVCGLLPDAASVFVGAAVFEPKPDPTRIVETVLHGLAASCALINALTDDLDLAGIDTDSLPRFEWLLMRLLHPAGTDTYAIRGTAAG